MCDKRHRIRRSIAAVARRAEVATGSVYRHFPSKAELFAEVFRNTSQREVDAVTAAVTGATGPAPARIAAAVEVFAQRALAGRRRAVGATQGDAHAPY